MDQKRLLIATVLSMAILVGWQWLFPPQEPPITAESSAPGRLSTEYDPDAPPTASSGNGASAEGNGFSTGDDSLPQSTSNQSGSTESGSVAPVIDPESFEAATVEETFVLASDTFRATFTNRGAQLVSFELLRQFAADGEPIDVVRKRSEPPYPFAITAPSGKPIAMTTALFVAERSTDSVGHAVLNFRYSGPEGQASKRFALRDDGLIDLEIQHTGNEAWSVVVGPGVQNPTAEEVKNRFGARQVVYRRGGEVERVDARKTDEREVFDGERLDFVGLQDNYFLTSFLPNQDVAEVGVLPRVARRGEDGVNSIDRFDPEDKAKDSESVSRELLISLRPLEGRVSGAAYLGAKSYDRLSALPGGLEDTIDFGFFAIIAKPLLFALLWIYNNVVQNYGWSIVILTTLIKILLFPLTHKSQVSMQKMQDLNPKMQAIRNSYRSKLKDKQGRPNVEVQRKMNQEIMGLYSSEGVNPAGGCVPMLMQLPVFFAFYSVLGSAGELRGAPWIFWIQDLSSKDPLYTLPIVMGISQFLQQKITPMTGDPMQRRMMQFLPVVFTFLFLGLPSGLVLYWTVNNVLTGAQMLIYRRFKDKKEALQPRGKANA